MQRLDGIRKRKETSIERLEREWMDQNRKRLEEKEEEKEEHRKKWEILRFHMADSFSKACGTAVAFESSKTETSQKKKRKGNHCLPACRNHFSDFESLSCQEYV